MKFHHLGIATKDIDKTSKFLKKNFVIRDETQTLYDKYQDAYVKLLYTDEMAYELVSGNAVNGFVEKHTTYYHVCYEVSDIQKSIDCFIGAMVVREPLPALLFENRRVCFLMSPIGLIELLEAK